MQTAQLKELMQQDPAEEHAGEHAQQPTVASMMKQTGDTAAAYAGEPSARQHLSRLHLLGSVVQPQQLLEQSIPSTASGLIGSGGEWHLGCLHLARELQHHAWPRWRKLQWLDNASIVMMHAKQLADCYLPCQ